MENWEAIERRKHQDRLTDLWCDELRTFRLEKFKEELEKKQPDFLRRKASLMKEILEEEIRIGQPPSINESEIEELIKKADAVEQKLEKGKTSEKEYNIFEEKVISDSVHFQR